MRVAVAIELSDEEQTVLTKWSRGRSTPARLVLRAKIVLAAAEGMPNKDIAARLGCKRETVSRWRNRFAEQETGERLASLEQDAPRPVHPPVVWLEHEVEIIRKTTKRRHLMAHIGPHARWPSRWIAARRPCNGSGETTGCSRIE